MKHLNKVIIGFASLFLCMVASAQPTGYSAINAHAHNDYLNPRPFFLAFENGFGSIEADIFPVNGVLCVAHSKKEIQPRFTLSSMYLTPLLNEFKSGRVRKLSLLIDIKEDYATSLPLLVKELEPLRPYLATSSAANYLSIIISGNRPPPSSYKDYPDFIFFDDDLKLPHTGNEWSRVALVSLPFTKISAWKGMDVLQEEDRQSLQHIIDSVHTAGKPIRFWAAPDTKLSWQTQVDLHADLVGTDQVTGLGDFFKIKNK